VKIRGCGSRQLSVRIESNWNVDTERNCRPCGCS